VAQRIAAKLDKPLIAAVAALCLLGLYNLSSAGRNVSESLYLTQAAYMAFGLLLASLAASIDYRNFEGLAIPIYVLVISLLVLTLVGGKVVKGSRRWLGVGPLALQTSDLAKLATVLAVAKIFHGERREGPGLTLAEIFRPMNISRPLIVVLAVLVITVAGDRVKPPSLKQRVGLRSHTLGKVKASKPTLKIGRAADCDVQIPSAGLDPHHAELVRIEDGHYVLRDLGSASGVYVNGERLSDERRLHDGDLLRFGLNPRSEVSFSATLEALRPVRSWAAFFGLVWLIAAMIRQFKKGAIQSRDVFAPIDFVAAPFVLILVQPDLGTAMVTLLVSFSIILYVGLAPLSLIALGVGSILTTVFAWFYVLKPYQKMRVLTFIDPTTDLSGAGYHQHQSLIAIGSGGLDGKGYGQGTQTQLSFLPEQQTDFIFSVWSEEHGFVGSLIVVLLFVAVVLLSLRIATQAKDRFGTLLALGMTALVFWHAVINMLMVIRLAPVVGVPLPFWSYGGSFMLTVMVAVGVIVNVGVRRYVF
jgi:cell division protein FtsW (lipid II flippase)